VDYFFARQGDAAGPNFLLKAAVSGFGIFRVSRFISELEGSVSSRACASVMDAQTVPIGTDFRAGEQTR
jgi:hypothetical protein